MFFVYKIIIIGSDKIYYGTTNNINRRRREHIYKYKNKNNNCYNSYIGKCLRKYDFKFNMSILHEYDNKIEAFIKETEYIKNIDKKISLNKCKSFTTKEEKKEYQKEYDKLNKENKKEYYQKNKEYKKEYQKEYNKRNK